MGKIESEIGLEGGNGATNGSGITHSPKANKTGLRKLPEKAHAEMRSRRGCSRRFKQFFAIFAFFAA